MSKNVRAYNWLLVLYPNEDESHKKALDYIISHYNNIAYINHDKDITESGELKKQHTHILISFDYQRWRNAIAEELKILPNYIEKCENMNMSLRYLIHYDNEDKAQYDINEVHGNLKQKLNNLLHKQDMSESEKILMLMDFIDSYNKKLLLSDFIRYVCSLDMYDTYRRSASTFIKLLDAQNYKIWELYHK